MRKILLSALITVNISPLFSQQQDLNALYSRKVYKYTVMNNYAIAGIMAGATLTATGIALGIQGAEIDSHNPNINSNYLSSDNESIYTQLSSGFVGLGVYALGGSIVLAIISHKKINKYKDLRDRLTYNFNITPVFQGLAVSYRF